MVICTAGAQVDPTFLFFGNLEIAVFGVAFSCDDAIVGRTCADYAILVNDVNNANYKFLSIAQRLDITSRTVCCTAGGTSTGICINENVNSCCNGIPFFPAADRCCNSNTGLILGINDICPCAVTAQDPDTECPASEPTCCLPTKYPELAGLTENIVGQCYNGDRHRCCDTGARYDPGTDQCCLINGVQSLNIPCPCGKDADCVSPSLPNDPQFVPYFRCCQQIFPTPLESPNTCTKYANWPSGEGDYHVQPCLGQCIDIRYQICCNGVACVKEYERCCNSTCCNKYIGDCHEGIRPGSVGNPFNWVEFGNAPEWIKYSQCTVIESMSILQALWIFALPTIFLLMSLLGLVLVLVYANKTPARAYSIVERLLFIAAVLTIIFAFPFYFSPVYKYAIVIVFVSLLALLTASSHIKWLNTLVIIALIFVLLYIFDPFHGNPFLSFASLRTPVTAVPDAESAGLFHVVGKMWRNHTDVIITRYCTGFYNYFGLDPQLQDLDRNDNPHVYTFGYCSRGWTLALLVFAAILAILVVLLFVLAILARLLRFKRIEEFEPIELELRETPY
jgi:hypothetical protein